MTMRKRVTDARLAGNIGEYCTESIVRIGKNKKNKEKHKKNCSEIWWNNKKVIPLQPLTKSKGV